MRQVSELGLRHIPANVEAKPLLLTAIGSHLWGMNHEGSDVDSMAVVQEPTRRILRREAKWQEQSFFRSETDHGHEVDIHVHEAGRTADFLAKMNVNFVVGVCSPLVIHSTPAAEGLRRIVLDNLSRELYESIHGMAISNMARYAGIKRDTFYTAVLEELHYTPIDERRCGKMLAFLEFGIRVLSDGRLEFRRPDTYTWDTGGVVAAIKDLDIAVVDSKLPRKAPIEPFHDWLLDLREADLVPEWLR